MKIKDTKRQTATFVLFRTGNAALVQQNVCSYDILLQHPPSPITVVRPFIVGELVSYLGNSLLLACC
jgi:hypothetical protein